MARDTRLQKFLSEAGIASRRKSEEFIADGRVTVNGRRAKIGDKVDVRKDVVAVDGEKVEFPLPGPAKASISCSISRGAMSQPWRMNRDASA